VYSAVDVNVLLITRIRDEALVAALSHLVLDSRLLKIRVKASEETQQVRQGCYSSNNNSNNNKDSNNGKSNLTALDYCPSLIFDNNTTRNEAAKRLTKHYLLPFFYKDLQQLANMVCLVPNFLRLGIEFYYVLNIS
jgi:hypothetical protein